MPAPYVLHSIDYIHGYPVIQRCLKLRKSGLVSFKLVTLNLITFTCVSKISDWSFMVMTKIKKLSSYEKKERKMTGFYEKKTVHSKCAIRDKRWADSCADYKEKCVHPYTRQRLL